MDKDFNLTGLFYSTLLQKLTESLRDILANRDWDEFNQAVYRCANCTTQFCIDRQNQKAAERGEFWENKRESGK